MGFSGVIRFGGVRIGGLSGIYNARDYRSGYHERPPYTNGAEVKTIYHVREYEVFKLRQLREPLDIFLSHDWPRGIARHGDTQDLLRRKAFLREEVENNSLGSPPGEELLHLLKPEYWFSAHLHTKFAALVRHRDGEGKGALTKFLSLDKCLPKRDFLQIIEVPTTSSTSAPTFEFDPEWLAILRATHGAQTK
jgi:lariat debranching enzyme